MEKIAFFFKIKASRSAQAFHEVFGAYKGGLTRDRYGGYNFHEGPEQLCWSHADRDFAKIASREGFDKLIAEKLLDCKTTIFDLWHQFKDGYILRDELIGKIQVGERFVERVMTVAMTLKLQAKNSFDYFTKYFREFIHGGHSPPVFAN